MYIFIILSLLTQTVNCSPNLLVNTSFGQVLGHLNEVGIREWKGLPFAKPPVGDLRWEYPVEPTTLPQGQIYEANFDAPGLISKIFYLLAKPKLQDALINNLLLVITC